MNFQALRWFLFFVLLPSTFNAQIALDAVADSLINEGAYEAAKNHYQELAKQELSNKNFNAFLDFSIKTAVCWQNMGSQEASQNALKVLNNALIITANNAIPDTLKAEAIHKIGVSHYDLHTSIFYPAIENWQKAITLRKDFLAKNPEIPTGQWTKIIKGLRNIGMSHSTMGNYREANIHLNEALDLLLANTPTDTALLIQIYQYLGWNLSRQLDFEQAETYLNAAFELHHIFYKNEPWNTYPIYEYLFDHYKRKDARPLMKKYTTALISLIEGYEEMYNEDWEVLANAYGNLAVTYELMNELDWAHQHFQTALSINRRFPEKRRAKIAINLSNLSLVYSKQGLFQKALENIDEAIQMDSTANEISALDIAHNLNNKASILLEKGDLDLALRVQEKAIDYLLLDVGQLNTKAIVRDRPILIDILADKAEILKRLATQEQPQEYLMSAASTFQQIAQLTDELRVTFESDASKQYLVGHAKDIFEKGIAVHQQLFEMTGEATDFEAALGLAERSKAMVLLDAIHEAEARAKAAVAPNWLAKEQRLKQQYQEYETALYHQKGMDSALRDSLLLTQRALQNLLGQLKEKYPDYYDLKYNTTVAGLKDLPRSPKQTTIEYFIGKEHQYAFVVQNNQQHLIKLAASKNLANLVSQLRKNIANYPVLSGQQSEKEQLTALDSFISYSHQLYQILLAPIEKAAPLTENLLLIPDGVLGYLPFDVLLKNPPADKTLFHTYDYLIKKHNISYAYSANLLQAMQDKEHGRVNGNFLAFAPFFVGEAGTKILAQKGFGRLEHNIQEVKNIQELIGSGSQLFLNNEATKNNFLKYASDFRILHLSTHGRVNDGNSEFSEIVFAAPNEKDTFLYTKELYNLQLQADMVVLSACQTGLGELQNGEGIISLARGFSYAGAKSIVSTLWSVDEISTRLLLEDFYKNLKTGLTKDVALKEAKMNLMNRHPYYWAAFTAVGDMEAIELGSSFRWWYFLVGGLFLIISYFFLRKYWSHFSTFRYLYM